MAANCHPRRTVTELRTTAAALQTLSICLPTLQHDSNILSPWYLPTSPHGVTAQNIIFTAVSTSYLTMLRVFLKLSAIADHFLGGRSTQGPKAKAVLLHATEVLEGQEV
jgi:hypothetical protein